jgi:pimeloyl-ACP methyl ester carboxylesterase
MDKVSPKPVLIGHSMGGFLTLKILESTRLPAAVLLASVPSVGTLPFLVRMFRRHFRAWVRVFATNSCAIAEPAMARDMFLSADTEIDVQDLHGKLVAESMSIAMELTFLNKSRPERVASPTFVIAAENDACFTVREQENLAKALNAKYEVLPGTAHNIMMEPNWRQTADRIDAWITQDLGLP